MRQNETVRREMRLHEIKVWQLAQELGVSDMTIFRRFRRELLPDEEARMLDAIQRIVERKQKEAR